MSKFTTATFAAILALAAMPALAQTGVGGPTAAGGVKGHSAAGGAGAGRPPPKSGAARQGQNAMMPKKSGGMSGAMHKSTETK